MPIQPIARKGDREAVHCTAPRRDGHFRSVFANNKPVSGQGHKNTVHLFPIPCPKGKAGPCCAPHRVGLRATQWAVFAEGVPVGRVGDPTCTVVTQGSPNVFVGGGVSGGRSKFGVVGDIITVAGWIPAAPAGPVNIPRGPGSAI
jgi:hypothetical protein